MKYIASTLLFLCSFLSVFGQGLTRNSVTTNAHPANVPSTGEALVWTASLGGYWTNGTTSAAATNAINNSNGMGTNTTIYVLTSATNLFGQGTNYFNFVSLPKVAANTFLMTDNNSNIVGFASGVLTNLVGTAARNVTNVVSLSTTNATSKPVTNSYTAGVLTLFGLEQGSGHILTVTSNIVVAADWAQIASTTNVVGVSNWVNAVSNYVSASNLQTNNNQFGPNVVLNIKDGANLTNLIIRGMTNTGSFSNSSGVYVGGVIQVGGQSTFNSTINVGSGVDVQGGTAGALNWGGNETLGGSLTLTPQTASTILSLNGGKAATSVANGTGMLTNDGAGVFGWMGIPSGGAGAGVQTNANQFAPNVVLNIKDGANLTNLIIRGMTNFGSFSNSGGIYIGGSGEFSGGLDVDSSSIFNQGLTVQGTLSGNGDIYAFANLIAEGTSYVNRLVIPNIATNKLFFQDTIGAGTTNLVGIGIGANLTISGGNLVASGGAGSGVSTNDNQFGQNVVLNIKSGALVTNLNTFGLTNIGTFTNSSTADIAGSTRLWGSATIEGNVLINGGDLTHNALTGDTMLKANSSKQVVSVANSAGMLTNNGAGVFGWMGIPAGGLTSVLFTNEVFVSPTGNDATGVRNDLSKPFSTLTNALAATIPGDIVVLLPGTYSVRSNTFLNISNNVGLVGSGIGVSVIHVASVLNTTGPSVVPGDNSYIANLSIIQTNRDVTGGAPMGTSSGFSQKPSTNVIVDTVQLLGGSDAFYLLHSNRCSITVMNSIIESDYDAFVWSNTNGIATLLNTRLIADGSWAVLPSNPSTGIRINAGTVNVDGGDITTSGPNGSNIGILLEQANATNRTAGTRFDVQGVAPTYDVHISAAGFAFLDAVRNVDKTVGPVKWLNTNIYVGKIINSNSLTLAVNGVTNNWPTAQGSAQSVLTNDGVGNLGWGTAASGGGNLQTNASQFGANTVLNIKSGALVTNLNTFGLTNIGTFTNSSTADIAGSTRLWGSATIEGNVLINGGDLTHNAATADTILKVNSSKQVVSVANSAGMLTNNGTGTFGWMGIPAGGGGLTSLDLSNTVYVSKNGSDSTGVRARLDKPFFTIDAARLVARTNDTVVVYPGIYTNTTPIAFSNMVDFVFLGSGSLFLTNTLTNGLFIDGAVANLTNHVEAPGWIFMARTNQRVIELSQPGLHYFNLGEAYSDSNHIAQITNNAVAHLAIKRMITTNATAMIQQGFGSRVYFKNDYGENKFGAVLAPDNSDLYADVNRLLCSRSDGSDHDEAGCLFALGDGTNRIFLNANWLHSESGWTVWVTGTISNAFVNANTISAGGDCTVVSGATNLTVSAQIYESTNSGTYGILNSENGFLTAVGGRILYNGPGIPTEVATTTAGIVNLLGVSYQRTSISQSSPGTIRRLDTNFISGIYVTGGGVLQVDTITNSGAVDVTGATRLWGSATIQGNVLINGGDLTHNALTASTMLYGNSSKQVVSLANGTGVLTNNGSGTVGYMAISSLPSGGGGGTNFPPIIGNGGGKQADTNITVGVGVRQVRTIVTNASFALVFTGTPLNGEEVEVGVSNLSSSAIYLTNTAGIFDPTVASNNTTFAIGGTSARWFTFKSSTNWNLGTQRWELHHTLGKEFELAAAGYIAFTTNAANSIITVSNGSVILGNLANTGAITNLISLSLSNNTIKPLVRGTGNTAGQTNTTGIIYGIEAGSNITLTENGSNYVIASTGGSGSTNNVVEADGNFILTNSFFNIWHAGVVASIYATNGDSQFFTLGSHTNLDFVPYTGADSSNHTGVDVVFTQNATGGWYPTNNGQVVQIMTNANRSTMVTYFVYVNATNFSIAYPFSMKSSTVGPALSGPTDVIELGADKTWTNGVTIGNGDVVRANDATINRTKAISHIGTVYQTESPAITVSNLFLSFSTNRYECVGLTNIVLTNIQEIASGSADLSVTIRNTLGVSIPIVWPAYGAQHGYYFRTNINNAVLAKTTLGPTSNLVVSLTATGTNIYGTFTEWP